MPGIEHAKRNDGMRTGSFKDGDGMAGGFPCQRIARAPGLVCQDRSRCLLVGYVGEERPGLHGRTPEKGPQETLIGNDRGR